MQNNELPLVLNDFLTSEEELEIIRQIDAGTWLDNRDKSRRVQISGPYHDHTYKRIPEKFSKHPDYIIDLSLKIRDLLIMQSPQFKSGSTSEKWGRSEMMEVYINEFLPGQSLAPHFDHRSTYEDVIVGISLNSDSKITFTKGRDRTDIDLPRRSLYVMSGPSRNVWKHSISKENILGRRLSITFRTFQT